MKFLSLSNAIRFMVVIGVIAIFAVAVQSCQKSPHLKTSERAAQIEALSVYKRDSLGKLQLLKDAPEQPRNRFEDSSGNTMRLTQKDEGVILVNIWATWCAPCIVEMPSLDRLAGRGFENFEVLTISMDDSNEKVDAFFEKHGLENLTRWRDPSMNVAAKINLPGQRGAIPITIIYNRNGDEIARIMGEADWDSEEAIGLIKTILGED